MRLSRFLLLASIGCPLAFPQTNSCGLNADRLRTGMFRYRTLVGGQAAGQSEIQIRRSPQSRDYLISNLITGAFSQTWESVASSSFEPLSAKLTAGAGAEARPVFELAYRGGRVSGFAISGKTQPAARRAVDDAVLAGTVDQRIDWAAVLSFEDYAPGQECTFHVYDPGTGNSLVRVKVGPTETTRVPAGEFQTIRVVYRIEKNRGTEAYQVLAGTTTPRFMVKEEFPNGASTELVEAKP